MHIPLLTVSPLPRSVFDAGERPRAQRNLIGGFEPDPVRLHYFNALLQRVDPSHEPVDVDQLATAARELLADAIDGRIPLCIRERIRRAGAINLMRLDPDWATSVDATIAADTALDYLHGDCRLIPRDLPVVGWLDGALMIEVAWPTLASEVRDYVDFCRLRRIEAELRGESGRHFGFTRHELDDARVAEWLWQEHQRRIGNSSYLPNGAEKRFLVN